MILPIFEKQQNFNMKEKRERTKVSEKQVFPSLPLLDYLNKTNLIEERRLFKDYKVLVAQHLLGSAATLLSMFEKGGAMPQDIYVVGKAYSSHPTVVEGLRDRGYKVSEGVFDYVEDEPYDLSLERNIEKSFNAIVKETDFNNGKQKGLLIDDGGKAIKLLHKSFPELTKHFTCVELTSRGYHALKQIPLETPVINVARSEAKTIYESPLIAESMVNELLKSLNNWNNVFKLRGKDVLLLGYGFIGENVFEQLNKHGFNAVIYDSNPDKIRRAQEQQLSTIENRSEALSNADIVIGCSGSLSIPDNELQNIQEGALLVNMASTDTEFAAWNLRKQGQVVHERKLASDRSSKSSSPLPWRSLYKVNVGNANFYLANGGFPIDFSGSIDPIPTSKIQLTRALLLQAAVQATATREKGLIDLDPHMQEIIINEYLKLR
jgi:S-adenosylhomocysteine hydrolase